METDDIDHVGSTNAYNLHYFSILATNACSAFYFMFYTGVEFSADIIRSKKFSRHQRVFFSYRKLLIKSYVLVHTLQQFTFCCCSVWTIFITLTRYEFYNIAQDTAKNTKFQQIKLLHVIRFKMSTTLESITSIFLFFAWFFSVHQIQNVTKHFSNEGTVKLKKRSQNQSLS